MDADRRSVEEALRILTEGLGPWMGKRLGHWPPDRHGLIGPHDPSYLIETLLEHRVAYFPQFLEPAAAAPLYRIRAARNAWAHFEPPDHDHVQALVDDVTTVLGAIASPLAASIAAPEVQHQGPQSPASGHRRSRSLVFRAQQLEAIFADHCRPVNELVDELIVQGGGRWMPYVAPYHGGIHAAVLLLFQDPGRMTSQAHGGSGFIGCENDDPSAELLAICLDQARIAQDQVMPWNAYPWFLPDQGNVTAARRAEGLDPLRRVMALLPSLHTVVTGGNVAHHSWKLFASSFPAIAGSVRHFETFHTGGRGITNGCRQPKAVGVTHVVETLKAAAAYSR